MNARLLPVTERNGHPTRVLKTDLFEEAVGDGLVPLLAAGADEVHAIDLDPHAVATASARIGPALHAARADVRALPFPDGHFDTIVSTSTLDHFETLDELLAGLRELHRVLRPGGRLLVTLDNPANPVVRLRNALPFALLHRARLVPYFVGATCGAARLRTELRRLGFAVEREAAVLHCPRALAIPLARRIGRSRRGERFLRGLMAMELLGRLPTRRLTGHYVAVVARRR